MFIYHFNRLICNKFLWGAFAIVIAFAFVVSDINCINSDMGRVVGTLNGENISAKQFDELARVLQGNGRNDSSDMSLEEIERTVWEQIAARKTIEKNGLSTTKDELIAFLRSRPEFQGANGFDMNRYRMIVAEMGMNPEAYENYLLQQLALMKGYAIVESASWIAPMELDDEIAALTDRFTVQVADFKNEFTGKDMKLTEADYKKYYEDNTNSFALPDRTSVRYVVIPASNYVDSVKIVEDDLRDYYDANLNSYTKTVSNQTVNLTFEEARPSILETLKLEEAAYCAQTAVTFTVYSDIENTNANALVSLSKELKAPLQTSALFSVSERLSFCGADSKAFAEAAFELDPERSDSKYGIVKGEKDVYVMERVSFEKAHVPAYDKVVARVKLAADANARSEAFKKACEAAAKRIRKALDDGKKFSESVDGAMNVSTQMVYTVNDISKVSFPNSFSVAYGAMKVPAGSISDAIPNSRGGALFVYVAKREPGDALSAEMMLPQIRAGLERRDGGLYADWLKENLAKQDFKPANAEFDSVSDDEAKDDSVQE